MHKALPVKLAVDCSLSAISTAKRDDGTQNHSSDICVPSKVTLPPTVLAQGFGLEQMYLCKSNVSSACQVFTAGTADAHMRSRRARSAGFSMGLPSSLGRSLRNSSSMRCSSAYCLHMDESTSVMLNRYQMHVRVPTKLICLGNNQISCSPTALVDRTAQCSLKLSMVWESPSNRDACALSFRSIPASPHNAHDTLLGRRVVASCRSRIAFSLI